MHATLSAQGFGAPRVSWDSKRPVTIILDGRLGRVDGRLITSDAKELPSPLELRIRPSSPPDEHAGGSFELVYLKIIKVGGDGRFRFDQLPPGRYTISVNDDPDSGYQSDGTAEVEIRPSAQVPSVSIAPQTPCHGQGAGDRRDERRGGRRSLDQCVPDRAEHVPQR